MKNEFILFLYIVFYYYFCSMIVAAQTTRRYLHQVAKQNQFSTYDVQSLVVGAGVVGLAVGQSLAKAGHDVLVVEQNEQFGMETSSRNSEVIHAGLYYRTGSQVAHLCVQGKQMLYEYCTERSIPFQQCGKLIVATEQQQIPQLHQLHRNAHANGVTDCHIITPADVSHMESPVRCVAAMHSPSTGIVNSHELMSRLRDDIEQHGGAVLCGERVQHVVPTPIHGPAGFNVEVTDTLTPDSATSVSARHVINCAGLHAWHVAQECTHRKAHTIPQKFYARGNYFALHPEALGGHVFKHLVYPMHSTSGLGIHLTIDMNGRARLGPDVVWVDDVDYTMDTTRVHEFYEASKTYLPDIQKQDLYSDYCGIRCKVKGPGERSEFVIQGVSQHGVRGLVELFGIESPGLTASLAIGDLVATMVQSE